MLMVVENLIIKGVSGNVGIGTATPTQKLDVNGSIVGDLIISTSMRSSKTVTEEDVFKITHTVYV